MSSTQRPRRRLALRDNAPRTGRQALAVAGLWLLIAIAAALGAILVLIDVRPHLARAVGSPLLVLLSVLAMMLASESAARWLDGRYSRAGGLLYWFATSVVALTGVVATGAAMTLLLRDHPGFWNVARDFALDLGVGLLAGVIATAVVLVLSTSLAGGMYRAQRRLGLHQRAVRWSPPSREADERLGARVARQLLRGAVLGAAGLLLSALSTALLTKDHTRGAEAPAPSTHSALLTVIVPLLLWFLGTGLVWLLLARRPPSEREHITKPHPRVRHGTHAAAFAILLLAGAGWAGATIVKHRAEHSLWKGSTAVTAVPVSDRQWSVQSAYVAQRFEPSFRLTTHERWRPTTVSWYLRQGGPATSPTRACEPHGCYQIHGRGCDDANPPPNCAPSGAAEPALYYRYVEEGDAGDQPASPLGSWKLIQYWIFYNYDSLGAGAITQWHQADWEQVSVLVRRTGTSVQPVEVAFSEHCYGARLPAERVRWSRGSHPVVYVGEGSHANYPRPVSVPVRQLRCSLGLTPRYFGVAGLFFVPAVDGASLELPVAYLLGLRDGTTPDRAVRTLPLISLPDTPAVSSFRGYWGLDNNLSLIGIGPARTGAGPPAPPNQGPWKEPLVKMLCSDSWLHTAPIDRSETSWICPGA
jgi:hypothetical protein